MRRLRLGAPILALILGMSAALLARTETPSHGLQYEELLTAGAMADEPLPLVIAIHGLGDRPESFARLFRDLPVKARVIVPRAPIPWGAGGSWFEPADTPKARRDLDDAARRLSALAATLPKEKPTVGRPIVTGFSQGGILSFLLAVREPEVFSAAFPVGGRLPKDLVPVGPAPKGGVVIRAFHGAADRRIPVGPTRDLVALLKERGWDATIQTYEGVGHQISAALRKDLYAAIEQAAAAP